MSFSGQLTQQATIYRTTQTRDAIGGVVDTWSAIISLAPCLVQARSARERYTAGATGVDVTHRMYMLPQTTAIVEKDEAQVGSVRYKILFVNNVRDHHLEIDLQEIRRGA